jgi:sec-independent protein translocase protein TatB
VFDIGFSEMVVCAVVALVVIGPERLPRVARTLGVLFGRLQRYVATVKADINREMEAADLGKVKSEFESAARSFQSGFESHARDVEREVREAQNAIEQSLADPAATAAGSPPAPIAAEPEPAPSPQLELGIEEPAPAPRDKPAH